jgi:hypothetical protein
MSVRERTHGTQDEIRIGMTGLLIALIAIFALVPGPTDN